MLDLDILRLVDPRPDWLGKLKCLAGLLREVSERLVGGSRQGGDTLESGADEGGDLLAGVKPGEDGQLLELSGAGLDVGKGGHCGHPDLLGLGVVVDDAEQDGAVLGGVVLG